MTLAVQLLLFSIIVATVIEFTAAKDLKEIALALRQKRQNELEQFEQNSVLEAQNDVALRNKRSGCGCCCCCCCCCCGCGRKKRQILTILRARRNSVADEIIKEAANDGSDYANKGYGTGWGDEKANQSPSNGGGDDGDCAECDEKK